MSVWLGVDLGDARVGLALSDPELMLAHPAGNVEAHGDSFRALDAVVDVIERSDVSRVVIGLPLLLNGTEGSSARKARRWGRSLGRRLESSMQDAATDDGNRRSGGAVPPIAFQDERLTTVTAHGHLRQASLDGRRHRPFVDQESAVIILQAALDAAVGDPREREPHVG